MRLIRRERPVLIGAIFLTTTLGAVLTSRPLRAQAQTATAPAAKAAFDECSTLLQMEVFNKAVERCEEAVRLDPQSPDAYFALARAHHDIASPPQPDATAPGGTAPDELQIKEHRRKAAENYKKFLALNRDDTDWRRRSRRTALGNLLGIYLYGETDEAILGYADQLAREPSLTERELLILAAVYAGNGRPDLSEKYLKRRLEADPGDPQKCQALVRLYGLPIWNGQSKFDDSIVAMERCAAQTPKDPAGYYKVATFLWDKAYRERDTLANNEKLKYIERGLGHIDRALSLKKDFVEALIYKGLLLRAKATAIADPRLQKQLLNEAGDLQKRAIELKAAGVPPHPGLFDGVQPPPPPPPALPAPTADVQSEPKLEGLTESPPPPPDAVRVGGEIKAPKKLKEVPAVYPDIAKSARVQGVVILECVISPQGNVVEANVLRSIPLLDQAAIDAVKQWVFTPTLLNGVPVAVIMTVTVNFTLQ